MVYAQIMWLTTWRRASLRHFFGTAACMCKACELHMQQTTQYSQQTADTKYSDYLLCAHFTSRVSGWAFTLGTPLVVVSGLIFAITPDFLYKPSRN